jgi:hypothetical protein
MTLIFRVGDRVEWFSPCGEWKPGSVEQVETHTVLVALDEHEEMLRVSPVYLMRVLPKHIRQLGSAVAS